MDLKQLHYFVTIANEGNITAAAKKLYMSQPPLSNQIHLLENELGCILFERGSRSIHLTDAGQTLYEYAQSILELSDVAKQETISSAKNTNQTIRIGIVSSVICSSALDWIKTFSIKYPDIHFEIIEGNTYELLQKFQSNLIHIAILRTPFNPENLTCETIFSDEMIAIGHYSLFSNNCSIDNTSYDITIEYLATKPLILYRRWEKIIKKQFSERNLVPNYYCINDDARTTLYFVESQMGIGLVPASASALIHVPEIECHRIDNCSVTSDVCLVYNASSYLPEFTRLFISHIKKSVM